MENEGPAGNSRQPELSATSTVVAVNVLSNNALQRNVAHRGHPALAMDFALAGVEWAAWPSAELGR